MSSRLRDNLSQLRSTLLAARARGGSRAAPPLLVAVTKSVPPELCGELLSLGQSDLGESRAQDLQWKAGWCAARGLRPRWHFIGHLQRNKARAVVRLADEIHSVDSPRLLETLERVAAEERRRPRLYLEVDFTERPDRTGLSPSDVGPLLAACDALEHVELVGLMTIAPPPDPTVPDPLAGARRAFGRLAALRDELPAAAFAGGRGLLSMGMSSDYELAVECGADVVRVGSALFEGLAGPPTARGEEGAA